MALADRILFHARLHEALRMDPLVLVDAGARGGEEPPWSLVANDVIRVLGFEPDEEACAELEASTGPNRRYLPLALWSEPGTVQVSVAANAACSSVHPPNPEVLGRYDDRYSAPRVTQAVRSFGATTLDLALAEVGWHCDFLKIDTQGAEHEILRGGEAELRDHVTGIVVETWTTEVHKGQRLTSDVMELLQRHGFELFDVNVAAAWSRAIPDGQLDGRVQVTGLDLLFYRHPRLLPTPTASSWLKAAATADAYGFLDYAVQILRGYEGDGLTPIFGELADHVAAAGRTRPGRFSRALQRFRPQEPGFASLHR